MYLPHDVFGLILSFKDPTRQVGVKGGIKTDSASAMPPYYDPCETDNPRGIVMTRFECTEDWPYRVGTVCLFIWDTEVASLYPNEVPWIEGAVKINNLDTALMKLQKIETKGRKRMALFKFRSQAKADKREEFTDMRA